MLTDLNIGQKYIYYIFVCSYVKYEDVCVYVPIIIEDVVYSFCQQLYVFYQHVFINFSLFFRVTCVVNVLMVYWSIAHFEFAKLSLQHYFTLMCDFPCSEHHSNYKLILTLTSNCNVRSSSVQTNNALKVRTTS